MRYSYVENGQVIENNRPLPRTWKNVSNFHLLDETTIKNYGWLKYRFIHAYPNDTQKVIGSEFEITNDEVIEHQLIGDKTAEEIQSDIENKWIGIRQIRNGLLLESDWTQLFDSPLSPEDKELWKIYRQSLRDITNFENPDEVIWPEKPGTENE